MTKFNIVLDGQPLGSKQIQIETVSIDEAEKIANKLYPTWININREETE